MERKRDTDLVFCCLRAGINNECRVHTSKSIQACHETGTGMLLSNDVEKIEFITCALPLKLHAAIHFCLAQGKHGLI